MGNLVRFADESAATGAADRRQYLTFLLGGEAYAIAILRIKEIIEYGQLTTVPMMPAFVRGVINLRGAVVPVVDLQARFGRERAEVSKRTCIVIVEIATQDELQVVGLVIDQVNEVVEIPAADIEPPPAFGAAVRTDFIAGMGKLNGRFVVLLELDAVLSVDDLAKVAAAGGATPELAAA
jgi:purine-binding chemotaxis protein CheW